MRKLKKSLLVPFALCLLSIVIPTIAVGTSMQPSLTSPPSLEGKKAGGLDSTAVSPPTVFAQTLNNSKAEAENHLAQGVEQLDANQFEAALESFQKALDIQRQIGERFGEAIALNNLGVVYYYQGQYEQAIAFQRESMQIFWGIYDVSGDEYSASRSGIGVTLNNQSIAYRQLEQYQQAIELCHGAIGIFRNMSDRTREAAALNNIGVAYEAIGEYQRAIGYFQEALFTVQGNSDARGEVITLSNIGEAYSKLGQSDQAVKFEQQANAIAQKIGEDVGIGGVNNNDDLLVRENKRSLAIIFSAPKATRELP